MHSPRNIQIDLHPFFQAVDHVYFYAAVFELLKERTHGIAPLLQSSLRHQALAHHAIKQSAGDRWCIESPVFLDDQVADVVEIAVLGERGTVAAGQRSGR